MGYILEDGHGITSNNYRMFSTVVMKYVSPILTKANMIKWMRKNKFSKSDIKSQFAHTTSYHANTILERYG